MQEAATSHPANFDHYGYGSNDNLYTNCWEPWDVRTAGMSRGGHEESYVMMDMMLEVSILTDRTHHVYINAANGYSDTEPLLTWGA